MKLLHYLLPISLAISHISCKKNSTLEEVAPKSPSGETSSPTASAPASNLESAEQIQVIGAVTFKGGVKLLPTLKPLFDKAKYDVKLYKVRYKTSYKNKEVIASGIVAIPINPQEAFPTLSVHHGTIFTEDEAPSLHQEEQLSLAAMASTGYLVVAPDYLGFGSSFGIPHPYYVSKYSASITRDMITAAKGLFEREKIKYNGKLFLAGYSQGGNVTLATAKSIEAQPLKDFTLTASAAGAGGYHLPGIFHTMNSNEIFPSPNYIAYVVQSFRSVYDWDTPLQHYFREPYASRIPKIINAKTPSGTVNSNLTIVFDSLMQQSFIKGLEDGTEVTFLNALKENSLHDWKPTKPLKFYHGDADEIVPYSDTEYTYKHMQKLGAASISFKTLPGKNHGGGGLPMLLDVLEWFNSYK